MKCNVFKVFKIKYVVAACIVLYNFCESWKLDFPQEENTTEQTEDEEPEQEHVDDDPDQDTLVTPEQLDQASCTADQIRQALASYVFHVQRH